MVLGWIAEKVSTAVKVRQVSKDPLVILGRHVIDATWSKADLQSFSPVTIETHRNGMMGRVLQMAAAPDRRMANREALVEAVLGMARFQVLVLPPPPEEDPSGLRGQPGITGQLKARVAEIAPLDKELRELFHAVGSFEELAPTDIWDGILLRYRIMWAWADLHHSLRQALDDTNPAAGRDWYRPFVAAQCAVEEERFRMMLGMPSAFGGSDHDITSLAYGTFYLRVLDGSRYPDLAWDESVGSVLRKGSD
ncbi:hypothetical protein [Muricoccus vinaceus]|uniref:Uncharacterized protein n=1 Tax=Muricoccus vinaceus TaxID=424704 RepID=A0ABV6J2J3_9PROT